MEKILMKMMMMTIYQMRRPKIKIITIIMKLKKIKKIRLKRVKKKIKNKYIIKTLMMKRKLMKIK